MNKLKSLTIKYFIRNKVLEVIVFIFGPYYLGKYLTRFSWFPFTMYDGKLWIWFITLFLLFMISVVGLIIYLIIESLIEWNWNIAKEQAKKEVKGK